MNASEKEYIGKHRLTPYWLYRTTNGTAATGFRINKTTANRPVPKNRPI